MEQPLYYWDPVIAPSGLAFYTGDLFPQWKNSLLVGALRGQMLDRLTLSGKKVVAEEPLLVELHAWIRDVRVGPEGTVYVLTDRDSLLKLTPQYGPSGIETRLGTPLLSGQTGSGLPQRPT
jgi:glucose/arabinose dehydrogenase